MSCDNSITNFTVTGTSDGSPAGQDNSGAFFFSPSTPQCSYVYSASYTVTISGGSTMLTLPAGIGNFTSSTSGSTTVNLAGTGGLLAVGWAPSGPPFTVPAGEHATINFTFQSSSEPPTCWSITGIRKNGRKWQRFGPNRLPSKIHIPKDVDPESCIIIEDGRQVPNDRVELIQ